METESEPAFYFCEWRVNCSVAPAADGVEQHFQFGQLRRVIGNTETKVGCVLRKRQNREQQEQGENKSFKHALK